MAEQRTKPPASVPTVIVEDEPGMSERFQRGLQRALNTPAQHRTRQAKLKRIAKAKPMVEPKTIPARGRK